MKSATASSSFSFLRSVFPGTVTVEPIEDAVVVVDASAADLSSYWEFINASDADSSDTESLLSDENGFVSLHDSSAPPPSLPALLIAAAAPESIEKDDQEEEGEAVGCGLIVAATGDLGRAFVERRVYDLYGGRLYGEEEVEEEEEEEEEEEYDELAAWNLSGKLAGKQRMRKVGKKGCQNKISNAKRNPYSYVKRGCAYGKHKA
ncbi:unnamed protein product [Linum tenue]|uniref:Uncharacterized protein n=1 Tax=Linum tenue TaxID=586396 RepID=A0AAV0LTK2_9ROSI|nr:unnamed protein product [Linum tenue]